LKIVLISVGAPKSAGLAAAIHEYESRIRHYFRLEVRETRPQRVTRGIDEIAVIEKESADLLAAVPDGLDIVLVERRGEAWTSEELAAYLEEYAIHGKPGIAFLIGGPLGTSESLRSSASRVLSLSSFTLPHELARLVLVEQLYRAGTIRRGEPYHK
jgi:23S rRNA (pseudouridine1915-N3)-methyltransferase